MATNTVQDFPIKTLTNLDVIEKATRYIAALDEHIRNTGCEHCKKLLEET